MTKNRELYWELGPDGPIAEVIDNFQSRSEQQQMAAAVAAALEQQQVLVAEAGTGTGKTFAYLVPSILSKSKVLISTGTKNLQDQLFFRDIPIVLAALKVFPKPKVALLKGRSNYLCLYRLQLNLTGSLFTSKEVVDDLHKIDEWSSKTKDGDISSVAKVSEKSAAWPLVTSTVDNCLGQECHKYNDCYVVKARREAMNADVVVVNHHLFFADVALKDDGFGELLPHVDAVIFDEAHQIPDIASVFYSLHFSSRQVQELCRDMLKEYEQTALDTQAIATLSETVTAQIEKLRTLLGAENKRIAWFMLKNKSVIDEQLKVLHQSLQTAKDLLKEAAVRSKELDNCFVRCARMLAVYKQFIEPAEQAGVQWLETFKQSFILHETPLSIADKFSALMKVNSKAWVFTSATIAIDKQVDYFVAQLGISDYKQLTLASPFDYQTQALLYLPRYLPTPKHPEFLNKLFKQVVPLIEILGGRTFLLFTSYKALNEAAELLSSQLSFPLLIQGRAGKSQLLNKFRQLENAVLLGTSSFWEGVDIKGERLSLVVIDKIPFASPSDPILQARMEMINKAGRDAFEELQVPQAIISLKQGVGRLIRDAADRGLLVIGDQRIVAKGYGQSFLASLPMMKRTRDFTVAKMFVQNLLVSKSDLDRA